MAASALFTFGYEGLDIEAFVARLLEYQVGTVFDVRELPLSRKKGFSKASFRTALVDAGIEYEHVPALGCPKPIRDRYRRDGDWKAYTRAFTAYLDTQSTALGALAARSRRTRACLVCFEADFTMCHRSFVARAAHEVGAPIVKHLTVRTVTADRPDRPVALADTRR